MTNNARAASDAGEAVALTMTGDADHTRDVFNLLGDGDTRGVP
jgi:hypothetical protein